MSPAITVQTKVLGASALYLLIGHFVKYEGATCSADGIYISCPIDTFVGSRIELRSRSTPVCANMNFSSVV